jgi:uncharacterized protein YchJ
MTDQSPTTIDGVIEDFGKAGHAVPRVSMQWALDNWAAAAPRFLELLSHYVDGIDRSDQTDAALIIVIHLLAEKAETAAFQTLCRLLLQPEGMENVLGDTIASKLSNPLISLFDGDVATLRAVVETVDVNEFVRHSAITAVAYLTRIGRIPEPDTDAWLRQLLTSMQAPALNDVWHGWVESVAFLGLADLTPAVQSLFEREFLDTNWLTFSEFEADLKLTLDDPDRIAAFAARNIAPIASAIDDVAELSCFAGREEFDVDWDLTPPPSLAPNQWSRIGGDLNPWRQVGRNDPCLCGSGKKFKKCCLGKPENERPIPAGAPRA